MDVTLVVVGGKTNTSEVKLSLPTIVGRAQECQLKLPHPLVSRRHCELFERDRRLFVRDLGSMNGTYVGSDRVEEAELPPQGLLTIGAVTFRALYESPDSVGADDNTHHDFGTETKSDVQTEHSVEIVDSEGPLDATHNDLTQQDPQTGDVDGATSHVDVALPLDGGKPKEKDAVRPE